eukprot:6054697-Pleurochrysis_carterae.AAC.1
MNQAENREQRNQLEFIHFLAGEEVSAVNVLRPRVVLRAVGQVNCRLVVEVQGSRVAIVFAKLVEEGVEVGGFFGGFRGRGDLGLARRKCNGGLLFAASCDSSLAVHGDVPRRGVSRGPV